MDQFTHFIICVLHILSFYSILFYAQACDAIYNGLLAFFVAVFSWCWCMTLPPLHNSTKTRWKLFFGFAYLFPYNFRTKIILQSFCRIINHNWRKVANFNLLHIWILDSVQSLTHICVHFDPAEVIIQFHFRFIFVILNIN